MCILCPLYFLFTIIRHDCVVIFFVARASIPSSLRDGINPADKRGDAGLMYSMRIRTWPEPVPRKPMALIGAVARAWACQVRKPVVIVPTTQGVSSAPSSGRTLGGVPAAFRRRSIDARVFDWLSAVQWCAVSTPGTSHCPRFAPTRPSHHPVFAHPARFSRFDVRCPPAQLALGPRWCDWRARSFSRPRSWGCLSAAAAGAVAH